MFKSILFYTDKIKVLSRFYKNVLELDITESNDDQFTVKIGESKIIFKQSERAALYHFAINIPGNQFSIMKHWIQDRLTLTRDAGVNQFYSQDFNADYMYFEDPAGNVIKLIGRRNRDLFGNLTSDAFLNVAEVKIVTPFVAEVGDELQDFGIPLHYGAEVNPDSINYLGAGDTYIALEPPTEKQIFSNHRATHTYPLEITLNNGGQIRLDEKGKIILIKEETKEENKD